MGQLENHYTVKKYLYIKLAFALILTAIARVREQLDLQFFLFCLSQHSNNNNAAVAVEICYYFTNNKISLNMAMFCYGLNFLVKILIAVTQTRDHFLYRIEN